MPHRRQVQKGSFVGHFDELVAQFPASETSSPSGNGSPNRPHKLQEKIDIHALLFELVWKLDGER
jgi:hypothetical protein